jgi:hypothetical protein
MHGTENLKFIRIYIYVQGNPAEIQNRNTLEPYWPQHDGPVDCDIAQQYSSAAFLPLQFHSHNEKLSASFKYVIISLFTTSKLPKCEIA